MIFLPTCLLTVLLLAPSALAVIPLHIRDSEDSELTPILRGWWDVDTWDEHYQRLIEMDHGYVLSSSVTLPSTHSLTRMCSKQYQSRKIVVSAAGPAQIGRFIDIALKSLHQGNETTPLGLCFYDAWPKHYQEVVANA